MSKGDKVIMPLAQSCTGINSIGIKPILTVIWPKYMAKCYLKEACNCYLKSLTQFTKCLRYRQK